MLRGAFVALSLLSSVSLAGEPGGKGEVKETEVDTPGGKAADATRRGASPQTLATVPAPAAPAVQLRSDAKDIRLVLDVNDPAAIADAWTGELAREKQKRATEDAAHALHVARNELRKAVESGAEAAIATARKKVSEREDALALAQQLHEPALLIDDVVVPAAKPVGFSYANKRVWFKIDRLPEELQRGRTRDVPVSVDYPDPRGSGARGGMIRLVVIKPWGGRAAWILGIIILLVVIVLGRRTNFLRDRSGAERGKKPTRWWHQLTPNFTPAGRNPPPFSLARCQMAFWTVLFAWGWLYLLLASGQATWPSDSILAVLGIATGTLLGARVIDRNKDQTAAALEARQRALGVQQNTLAGNTAPGSPVPLTTTVLQAQHQLVEVDTELQVVKRRLTDMQAVSKTSEGLAEDLLSDESGISIHRLQMVLWTLVLGGFFISTVLNAFSMPELHGNLLALMGISSGAYLGFKLPEKHTT